ncbi:MAG: hypothetical protein AAFO79_12170, partial [Pseudomonadota bacterium]
RVFIQLLHVACPLACLIARLRRRDVLTAQVRELRRPPVPRRFPRRCAASAPVALLVLHSCRAPGRVL